MKTFTAFAAVLFAASQLSAQDTPPVKPTDVAPTQVKPVDSKPAPTVKAPVKKDEKPKPAPAPTIPGLTIVRANGTFLGLQVVDARFKLSFYDAKKKAVAPDVSRVAARWPNPRAVGDFHDVLSPSGNAMVGFRPVTAPFSYNLHLILLQGEGDDAKVVETFVVPFRG